MEGAAWDKLETEGTRYHRPFPNKMIFSVACLLINIRKLTSTAYTSKNENPFVLSPLIEVDIHICIPNFGEGLLLPICPFPFLW